MFIDVFAITSELAARYLYTKWYYETISLTLVIVGHIVLFNFLIAGDEEEWFPIRSQEDPGIEKRISSVHKCDIFF